MNHFIVTGTSRGIGAALARNLLDKGNTLFCISRSKNSELITAASSAECALHYFEYDLTITDGLDELMEGIFRKMDLDRSGSLSLVNNAGILEPVGPLYECGHDTVVKNITLNLLAPMLLSASFTRLSRGYGGPKKIINISSGAARKAYRGWGSYCTAKAGIDHFTRCAAAEQEGEQNPVIVISFTPGVVDTAMQEVIRNSSAEAFPERSRFIKYAEEGNLLDPDFVAGVIAGLLADNSIPQGSILDIRTMDERRE